MLDTLLKLPNTFIPLFVAMDAFVALGIFLSLTKEMPRAKVKAVIRESILTALAVGAAFMAIGEAVFGILGITANDFKIAGGLVLLVLAVLDLVTGPERTAAGKLGVVPIGVPLIVGPAVLTSLIVLMDHYGVLLTAAGFLLNLLIVWASFANAGRVVRIFGLDGIRAIAKIMALLLTAIAVMMIRLGLEGLLKAAA